MLAAFYKLAFIIDDQGINLLLLSVKLYVDKDTDDFGLVCITHVPAPAGSVIHGATALVTWAEAAM
jgi:hypothetical protein